MFRVILGWLQYGEIFIFTIGRTAWERISVYCDSQTEQVVHMIAITLVRFQRGKRYSFLESDKTYACVLLGNVRAGYHVVDSTM
jgi:hypothetical protein